MESAGSQGRSGPEEAAFRAALERFGRLLRAVLIEFPSSAGALNNDDSVGRRLAVEFERWLRDPASMPPWWQNLQMAQALVQPPSQSGRPFNLGSALNLESAPSPLAQNHFIQAYQRVSGLMARWSQLQAQLAMHWNAVARTAGERFRARATNSAAALDLTSIRKLYDLWIECAEQAYAATVHTDDFCRTQAELVNVTTSLLLEQRRQVESFAPMLGLVTRSEVDALRREVKRMQTEPRPASGRRASKGSRRKVKTR
jgi:Poly(R)-hydroxyalkanoic acid synthase subunit (PHA_synth_III_E)